MSASDMIEGEVPASTLTQAENDADLILSEVYQDCLPSDTLDPIYVMAKRYYTAHLLYTWGFGLPLIGSSVGDVSITKGTPVNLGDKIGVSPYYYTFKNLLKCPSGDFLYSI